jgi:hypothetical protein
MRDKTEEFESNYVPLNAGVVFIDNSFMRQGYLRDAPMEVFRGTNINSLDPLSKVPSNNSVHRKVLKTDH